MVFGTFSKMIGTLPEEAILKALDLECKTLEGDLENHRIVMKEDAFSVLCFRQFVRLAKTSDAMRCLKPLPFDHLDFYKQTVLRLVKANQLPESAMKQFDYTFPLA